ncbi:hypothetical protein ACX0HA_15925, partial [Flavobacterium hauense]
MKQKLLLLATILFLQFQSAQSQIMYFDSNCFGLLTDWASVDTSGTRTTYYSPNGDLTIIWLNNRWEIRMPGILLYYNTTNTSPNPPGLGVGTWVDYGGCGNILRFDGSGTVVRTATITTTVATGIGSTSAVLGGNITNDGGYTVTARGIVWATTTNPTLSNNVATNGSGNGTFSATVSGLPPYTLIHYRAYATNSEGTSYGENRTFTTTTTLSASQFQTDITCYNGHNGTATVTVSGGKTPYTYVWSPSGGSNPTASGLTSGNYSVNVTDSEGASLTRNFTLYNPAATPVTFTTQPASNSVCTGSGIILSSATSNATTYKWYVSTAVGNPFVLITGGGQYSNESTANLSIGNITTGMNGYRYQVLASHLCASATSDIATLTVNTAPAITAQPANSTICAAANTTFTATASNATGYQWQGNFGAGFVNITNGGIYSGATTSTLTLTGATAGMNGYQYRLVATGGCTPNAVASSAATLTVNSAPAITAQPANSTTCVGGNTTFTATASNATGYQWQENYGAGFIDVTNGGIYSGATTATLTLTGVTAVMNGYAYRLVATGGCTPGARSSAVFL